MPASIIRKKKSSASPVRSLPTRAVRTVRRVFPPGHRPAANNRSNHATAHCRFPASTQAATSIFACECGGDPKLQALDLLCCWVASERQPTAILVLTLSSTLRADDKRSSASAKSPSRHAVMMLSTVAASTSCKQYSSEDATLIDSAERHESTADSGRPACPVLPLRGRLPHASCSGTRLAKAVSLARMPFTAGRLASRWRRRQPTVPRAKARKAQSSLAPESSSPNNR
mmetsp:Transcript_71362/g.197059  ORF Transcript_71362/g.197059 Transcript_71362/m.197059 type:complete len:229 (+) Transcript_71362:158-844(+)